jgi:outer membrane protein
VKTPSIIFQAVLGIAVLVLYILHFTKTNTNNTSKVPATPIKVINKDSKNAEAKIGYYNIDTLQAKYQYYLDAKRDLENQGRVMQSDLNNRKKTLENSVISFEKTAASMTKQKIEETQQGLAMEEQKLMQYARSQESEFIKKEQKVAEKMVENISDFLKKFAEANGYAMIYAYSKNNFQIGLTYAQSSYEITEEIIKGLNEEYKNQSKK